MPYDYDPADTSYGYAPDFGLDSDRAGADGLDFQYDGWTGADFRAERRWREIKTALTGLLAVVIVGLLLAFTMGVFTDEDDLSPYSRAEIEHRDPAGAEGYR